MEGDYVSEAGGSQSSLDYEPNVGEADAGVKDMRAEIQRSVRGKLGDLKRAEIRATALNPGNAHLGVRYPDRR